MNGCWRYELKPGSYAIRNYHSCDQKNNHEAAYKVLPYDHGITDAREAALWRRYSAENRWELYCQVFTRYAPDGRYREVSVMEFDREISEEEFNQLLEEFRRQHDAVANR